MSIVKCPYGHIYNNETFRECPNCALIAAGGKPAKDADGRTIAFFSHKKRHEAPVAGWLVCISGPDEGEDFRIIAGRNPIGRAELEEKFSITLSDPQISRSGTAAIIAYDPERNQFLFSATPSANLLPYVDGEPALSNVPLQPFSEIEIGETILVFVPFCGERFIWKTNEEKKSANEDMAAAKPGETASESSGHFEDQKNHSEGEA